MGLFKVSSRLSKYRVSYVALIAAIFIVSAQLLSLWSAPFHASASASCVPPSTTYGAANESITTSEADTYTIWVRIQLPSTSTAALLLNIDNSAQCYDIGDSSANSWQWIDYQAGDTNAVMSIPLGAGTHTFQFTGLLNMAELDRIEVIPQNSCTPTDTGDNCANASSSGSGSTSTSGSTGSTGTGSGSTSSSGSSGSSSSSGSSGSTSGHSNTSKASSSRSSNTTGDASVSTRSTDSSSTAQSDSSDSSTTGVTSPTTDETTQQAPIQKVEYLVNNKLVATETQAPYSYDFGSTKRLNGTYTLTTKTYYASGTVKNTSKQIVVKNSAWVETGLVFEKFSPLLMIVFILVVIGVIYYFRRRNDSMGGAVALTNTKPSDFFDMYNQATGAPAQPSYPQQTQGPQNSASGSAGHIQFNDTYPHSSPTESTPTPGTEFVPLPPLQPGAPQEPPTLGQTKQPPDNK